MDVIILNDYGIVDRPKTCPVCNSPMDNEILQDLKEEKQKEQAVFQCGCSCMLSIARDKWIMIGNTCSKATKIAMDCIRGKKDVPG